LTSDGYIVLLPIQCTAGLAALLATSLHSDSLLMQIRGDDWSSASIKFRTAVWTSFSWSDLEWKNG